MDSPTNDSSERTRSKKTEIENTVPHTDTEAENTRDETPPELKLLGIFFSKKNYADALSSFSRPERRVFFLFLGAFALGLLGILAYVNASFMVRVPAEGGSLTEGIIGAPRVINPLLAVSDADRDLTALIYSGLMRAAPDGTLIPDLAEIVTVSDDGLSYTFTLRTGITWHDGTPLTSDDVLFTISKIQDGTSKSQKRASWEGVTAEKIDERTFRFTLKQPYSPFLENTTLGILPKHIWEDVPVEEFAFSQFNTEPIGSGPYKIKKLQSKLCSKDGKCKEHEGPGGVPVFYDLEPFKNFALGRPFIDRIRIRVYANEEELLNAFERGEIESVNAIRSQKAWELEQKNIRVERYILPRVFGAFLNQNQNTIFTNESLRKALNESIDRAAIIQEVLFGYATPLYGPLPPGALGYMQKTSESIENEMEELQSVEQSEEPAVRQVAGEKGTSTARNIENAIAILEDAGWQINDETGIRERAVKNGAEPLSFSLATSDIGELKKTAELLRGTWEELGAKVELKVFNAGDLTKNVIRTRKYDALFFGEIIGRESDPFPFWHSSQRNDPGLNIALYANITVDKLLEEGRTIFDDAERIEKYKAFEEEVEKDIPAIFVYSPDFIYVLPEKLKGVTPGIITIPSERFIDVHTWFIEIDRVWKIFADDPESA